MERNNLTIQEQTDIKLVREFDEFGQDDAVVFWWRYEDACARLEMAFKRRRLVAVNRIQVICDRRAGEAEATA